MELEVIEPELFLHCSAGADVRAATALIRSVTEAQNSDLSQAE
jgi:hypothetical protein